jgi:hypothetical protein
VSFITGNALAALGLVLALSAALQAGRDALPDTRNRTPAGPVRVALPAATEVLDGLALETSGAEVSPSGETTAGR